MASDFQSKQLARAIKGLSARQKAVICSRYGFDGQGWKTLEQVATKLSITREHVRQVEKRALGLLVEAILTPPCPSKAIERKEEPL